MSSPETGRRTLPPYSGEKRDSNIQLGVFAEVIEPGPCQKEATAPLFRPGPTWTHLRIAARFSLALITLCNSFMFLFRGTFPQACKKKKKAKKVSISSRLR